jgi:hypothetical protein
MESVVLQKAPAMDGRRPHITPHQKCTKWEFKNGAALRKHRSGTLAATNLKPSVQIRRMQKNDKKS